MSNCFRSSLDEMVTCCGGLVHSIEEWVQGLMDTLQRFCQTALKELQCECRAMLKDEGTWSIDLGRSSFYTLEIFWFCI